MFQNEARKIVKSAKAGDITSSFEFYNQIYDAKSLAELHDMNEVKAFLDELSGMHAVYKAKLNQSTFHEIEGYLVETPNKQTYDKETAIFFDRLNNIDVYKRYLKGR